MRALPRTISARTVSIDHVSTRRMNFTIRWTDLTTDEIHESQMMIHYRVTFENLTALATKINEVYHGKAKVINTSGRASKTWGQPWLTRYLRWKRQAGQRKLNATNHTSLP